VGLQEEICRGVRKRSLSFLFLFYPYNDFFFLHPIYAFLPAPTNLYIPKLTIKKFTVVEFVWIEVEMKRER